MITKFTGDGLFFTSDTHFNHKKILDFTKRPYSSIEEHDEALIENWNSVVGLNDTVFHLGDFCFGNPSKVEEIAKRLNGHIILIRGNHDDKNLQKSLWGLFEDVLYQARISVDGRSVYLNHFPFLCFAHGDPKIYKDAYHYNLFGHVHSGTKSTSSDVSRLRYLYPTQYDVGVDNNNMTPVSWEWIDNHLQEKIKKYLEENENN